MYVCFFGSPVDLVHIIHMQKILFTSILFINLLHVEMDQTEALKNH